uniref:Uncharacterized protein n=1 Tax=Palpitomonas bilix TaxID=652834 RepID=A0A7S3LWH5_9EUKA
MEQTSMECIQGGCLDGWIPTAVLLSVPPTWLPPLFFLVTNALQRSEDEWDTFEREIYQNGSSFLSIVKEMNAWDEDDRSVNIELLEGPGATFMSWFEENKVWKDRVFDKLKEEGITQSACCHLFSECETRMEERDDQENQHWTTFREFYQSLPE